MNPRGVSIIKSLTERERERRTRTAVDGFINARDIHSVMGRGTKTIMVVRQ